jgi:hypothetical protein
MLVELPRITVAAAAIALVVGATPFAALTATSAKADQPHMRAALASLQQARQELEQATAGKGGHRATAIRLVEDAIKQVKAGIEFAGN